MYEGRRQTDKSLKSSDHAAEERAPRRDYTTVNIFPALRKTVM